MRSEVYRFTEFRTSLCVSQFAASFIDTRAKASTAARDKIKAESDSTIHRGERG